MPPLLSFIYFIIIIIIIIFLPRKAHMTRSHHENGFYFEQF